MNQGDKYRGKNNRINMVYRKIHGTIIEIFVEEFSYLLYFGYLV